MPTQAESLPTRRRASRRPYAVAFLVLGVLVVVPWFLRDRFQPVAAGSPAPDYRVITLGGEPVRIADYRGKVVLLNVWATWCEPCRKEMPSMERLYEIVRAMPGGEDFEILAVSIDAARERPNPILGGVSSADLQAFADELGLTFPIVHDPGGGIQRAYQTTGVPESFLIGKDGIIYKKHTGEAVWDAPPNVELIRSLLAR
jgi:cytochrome c biogenesis protein CcmG, thiol:disulfide interchange protein DsbE